MEQCQTERLENKKVKLEGEVSVLYTVTYNTLKTVHGLFRTLSLCKCPEIPMIGDCYPCLFTCLRRMSWEVSNLPHAVGNQWSPAVWLQGVVSKPLFQAISEFPDFFFSLSIPYSCVATLHDYLHQQPFYLTCTLKLFALVLNPKAWKQVHTCLNSLLTFAFLPDHINIFPQFWTYPWDVCEKTVIILERVKINNGQHYQLEF